MVPPKTPAPPDHCDWENRNSQKRKSCRVIFGTQTFGSQTLPFTPSNTSLQQPGLHLLSRTSRATTHNEVCETGRTNRHTHSARLV